MTDAKHIAGRSGIISVLVVFSALLMSFWSIAGCLSRLDQLHHRPSFVIAQSSLKYSLDDALSLRQELKRHTMMETERPRIRVQWTRAFDVVHEKCDNNGMDHWYEEPSLLGENDIGFRRLIIEGQLLIESAEDEKPTPIDWVQAVSVIVARRPDEEFHWTEDRDPTSSGSQRVEPEFYESDCVTDRDGFFRALIDSPYIKRSVGHATVFAVGLRFGEIRNNDFGQKRLSILWDKEILPQSFGRISIPGLPVLSETQQKINAAPSANGRNFDAVRLIQAVNHLQKLGKPQVLNELTTFLKRAQDGPNCDHKTPSNIDDSDSECVFLIVDLLFAPPPTQKRPTMAIWGTIYPAPADGDQHDWPHFPLELVDDIPFYVSGLGGAIGGVPQHAISNVEWAKRTGLLRKKPLHPSDEPVAAALKLLRSPKLLRMAESKDALDDLTRSVYRQVQRLLRPAISKLLPQDEDEFLDRDAILTRLESLKSHRVHWDVKTETFTAD